MADDVWGFDRDRAERLKAIADQNVPINTVNVSGRRRPTAIVGGGSGVLFTTRTGGIAARTTTAVPHTFPYATCDLIDPASGNYYSPNREADIRNSTNITIDHVAGRVHQAKLIGELYFIDVSGDC